VVAAQVFYGVGGVGRSAAQAGFANRVAAAIGEGAKAVTSSSAWMRFRNARSKAK
jgi:hypothetical protein